MMYPLSTGRAISGTEIRIMTNQDGMIDAQTHGEIVVRGPQVMKGYLGNPAATADTVRDGWLYTGDIGYLDEAGRLYVVDRKKDLIIRGGENIYPAEVEEVILRYPNIEDCAVVAQSDDIYQEVPVAFLTVRTRTSTVDVDALRAHCEANLARYKVPVAFHVVDGLPRTPSGKIKKFELKTLLADIKRDPSDPAV
jgi:long-chain acyl-CoA synthetase